MTDIFISYAREDRQHAETLAQALAAEGFEIWWDRSISPGETFDETIERALKAARCVVVLWSRRSVASRWVRTEAGEGAEREILVPALIEDVEIPLAFRRIQAANLISRDDKLPPAGIEELIDAVRRVLARDSVDQTSSVSGSPRVPAVPPGRSALSKLTPLQWGLALLALGLLIIFLLSQCLKIDGEIVPPPGPESNSLGPRHDRSNNFSHDFEVTLIFGGTYEEVVFTESSRDRNSC